MWGDDLDIWAGQGPIFCFPGTCRIKSRVPPGNRAESTETQCVDDQETIRHRQGLQGVELETGLQLAASEDRVFCRNPHPTFTPL